MTLPMPLPEIVSMDDLKLWLRLSHDHEDATLRIMLDAATEAVCAHTDHSFYLGHIPARMKLAVMTHVANAFWNREDGADLPASAGRLLNPMRRLVI